VDIKLVHGQRNLLPGEKYEVRSAVTNATEEELRAAGTDYPSWVLESYLQVPDSIPMRVHDLAREIVQDQTNAYDAVNAVTQYLRENIEYQDTIPPIPEDREAIDWILFDYQKGFCNYYASTEVILLRSLGIPARMAVGYAQGVRTTRFDSGNANIPIPGEDEERAGAVGELYEVRQSDLHAWPEVYFPGIGWVEFEPTGNQFPIQRVESNNPAAASQFGNPFVGNLPFGNRFEDQAPPENFEPPSEPLEAGRGPNPWLVAILALLGLALVAIPAGYYYRRKRVSSPLPVVVEAGLQRLNITPPKLLRRWAYYAALPPLARAYLQINQALIRLDTAPSPHDTPAERADRLVAILPNLKEHILLLGNEYQNSTYGHQFSRVTDAVEAGRLIRNVSWIEKFRRWFARFQEPPRPANPKTVL
jgi:transglutaminase-like putative cysteine protease